MILRFSLENWRSFKNKSVISAIAGKQLTHRDRLASSEGFDFLILPVIAIYGGNASGKSNIVDALGFAQQLVVEGTKIDEETGAESFALCKENENLPTRLSFELLIDEQIYEYSFSLTKNEILSENLTEIKRTTENVLFERNGRDLKISGEEKEPQLRYHTNGTRKNSALFNKLHRAKQ